MGLFALVRIKVGYEMLSNLYRYPPFTLIITYLYHILFSRSYMR